jgi:hypothetical protein
MKIKRGNRKRLTPKERATMWQRQGGKCACPCGELLSKEEGTVGEHFWFVCLGNSEKPDALYRKPCALKKTNGPRGDLTVASRVKRYAEGRTQADKRKERGPKLRSNSKLQGRGFDKSLSRKFSGEVIRRG